MTMAVIGGLTATGVAAGVSVVGLGVSLAANRSAASQANARMKGEADVSMASADIANRLRTAQAGATAAQNNLSRWVQSVNNNRALKAGGGGLEAAVVNYRRQSDNRLTQSFADGIREMEDLGARAATNAALGVGGATADSINASVALRNSIVRQQLKTVTNMEATDQQQRAGNIVSQMVSGLDNSLIIDAFDGNVSVGRQAVTSSSTEGNIAAVLQALPGLRDAGKLLAAPPAPTPALVDQPVQASRFGFNTDSAAFRLGDTSTIDTSLGTGLYSR